MNIGDLKELIKDLPDNTVVMVRGGYFYCYPTNGNVETIQMLKGDETFKYDVEWLKEIDALDEISEDDLANVLIFDNELD